MPCEAQQRELIEIVEEEVDGEIQKKEVVKNEKLLMPQIRSQLDLIIPSIDVIVREDRFSNSPTASGISSYSRIDGILGLLWWKYIGIGLRSQNGIIALGGKLTGEKNLLIFKMMLYAQKVFLTGEIGLKYWMVKNNK